MLIGATLFGDPSDEDDDSDDVTDDELAERIAASHPGWNNYQEDIKAQIGAAQVARWEGRPIEASRNADSVVVTFEIEGLWEARDLAIPVLLRDPMGTTLGESRVDFDRGLAHYTFSLTENWVDSDIPWVDLQYPHRELRIVFRRDGSWRPAAVE